MQRSTLIVLACFAFGCSESVESTDIRTTGIYPEITVTADGSGSSKVQVKLKVGGESSNTYLDLKGDDTLEATADGKTRTLDGSGETYSASFSVDAEDTEFVIAFYRGDEDDSAPLSTVSLPAPFELDVAATEASRASDDVAFSWDPPASGNVDWELEGECIKSDDGRTPDDGDAVIATGAIETFESDKDESCTVDLTVIRQRSGTIDGAFTEGGSIVARHVRSGSFTSNP